MSDLQLDGLQLDKTLTAGERSWPVLFPVLWGSKIRRKAPYRLGVVSQTPPQGMKGTRYRVSKSTWWTRGQTCGQVDKVLVVVAVMRDAGCAPDRP